MSMNMKCKGVFCLEGDWWEDLRCPSTVEPVFDLVRQIYPRGRFSYIHRGVGTREEFDRYMKIWSQQRYADHPIVYLAFHGNPRSIVLNGQKRTRGLTLDDVANTVKGRCQGRIVHFGACDTLACDRRHLKRFLKTTGALAVSGYCETIDWSDSAAFEVLYLTALQRFSISVRGMQAAYHETKRRAGALARELGFRMEPS